MPYFEKTTWTPTNMLEILNRISNTKRKHRPDLLPTTQHPDRPFDEKINNKESFDKYSMESYQQDPPVYEFANYIPTRKARQ